MTTTPLPDIDDAEVLHRRIFPMFIKPDGSLSSQAFTDPDMSVDRASYRTADESLVDFSGYGLAALTAREVRALDQLVYSDPLIHNVAHAIVKGKKPKKVARSLAKLAIIVVTP